MEEIWKTIEGYPSYMVSNMGRVKRIEEELNLHHQSISKCCKGRYGVKTVGGYVWKYYDKETYLIGIMNNNFKYAA